MKNKIPVLIVRDILLFPSCEVRFEINDITDAKVLKMTEENDGKLLLVRPLDVIDTSFDVTNLPRIGVLATIKMRMDMPNGKIRLVLYGEQRVLVSEYSFDEEYCFAHIENIISSFNEDKEKPYISILLKKINYYISNNPYVSNALLSQISSCETLSSLTDVTVSFMPLTLERKAFYLNEENPIVRSTKLIEDINDAMNVLKIEMELDEKVHQNLDSNQKEFILREKIKVIKEELGDIDTKESEVASLKRRLSHLKCSNKIKEKLNLEIHRYEIANSNSPEAGIIRDYIEWVLSLPFNKETKDNDDLNEVKASLDQSHFGLENVKERILEYLAVKQKTKSNSSPILCLVGPPGVGKTSLAISIAKSLNRNVCKMSLGGIHDEAEIIGHRRTYIGASPGRIIRGLRSAKSCNPVFIIDEIDKMTKDNQHDPSSALLEILDKEQNKYFSDHYIEEQFDLSKVFFIATANYYDQIPNELIDRLEIIEVSSYSEYEKKDIAKNYLIPKELVMNGLTSFEVSFKDDAILYLIRYYTKEAGVRDLERLIASILRKIVKSSLMKKTSLFQELTINDIKMYLGKEKYRSNSLLNKALIGVVNGLSYTPYGGDVLPIEVNFYKGTGKLVLTGLLGEVIKESAQIALSYIKSNASNFGVEENIFDTVDIHLHLPEGAVKKDGPSAGIALTSALLSAFTKYPFPSSISLTGEITLQGQVLPVGGLKEKIIGAHRSGIKTIYLSEDNKRDLDEIDFSIKKDLNLVFVKNYQEIFEKIWRK